MFRDETKNFAQTLYNVESSSDNPISMTVGQMLLYRQKSLPATVYFSEKGDYIALFGCMEWNYENASGSYAITIGEVSTQMTFEATSFTLNVPKTAVGSVGSSTLQIAEWVTSAILIIRMR